MDPLFAIIEARLTNDLSVLDRLVRLPSVAAQRRGLEETAVVVRDLFLEAGGRAEIHRRANAAPVVVAEFDGRSDRTLLFYNHYDVQPAEPLAEWTVPPFEVTVREGRIYGRGTSDNKGDLVTRLAAIRALREATGGLPCRVKFLVEGEEEIGSGGLPGHIAALRDRLAADACIWEYGDRDPHERLHILAGCKGICYVELEVEAASRDLHSSLGALVNGAATRLAWILAGLRDDGGRVRIPGFYDRVRTPPAAVRTAAGQVPFDEWEFMRFAGVDGFIGGRRGAALQEALLFEPTCTICGIESGYTGQGLKTVLPRRARAKVDFRLVPDQDPEEIVGLLRAHLDGEGFGECRITPMGGERAFWTDLGHPFVPLVVDAAAEATHRPIVLAPSSPGTGPMRVIGETLHMPILSLGCGYWGCNGHAPDEHIRMSDFRETIVLVARLLERFASA